MELRFSCSQTLAPEPRINQFLSSSHRHVTLPNTPLLISKTGTCVTLIPHNALSIWFANIMLKNLKFTDKKLLAINNLLFERKDIF